MHSGAVWGKHDCLTWISVGSELAQIQISHESRTAVLSVCVGNFKETKNVTRKQTGGGIYSVWIHSVFNTDSQEAPEGSAQLSVNNSSCTFPPCFLFF